MKASQIMTRDVLTIGVDTLVATAVALMVERRVSGLPVVDGDRHVLGMFTEGDLLHRAELGTGTFHHSSLMQFLLGDNRAASEYVGTHSRRVGDLMARDVAQVDEDASLQEVVDLMDQRHVRRVPVVRDDVLVGVISRLDLIRVLGHKLAALAEGKSDLTIEERLKAELAAQNWVRATDLKISVNEGVVTLEGFVYDDRVRDALRVAASNVAAGVSVDDRLVSVDPNMVIMAA